MISMDVYWLCSGSPPDGLDMEKADCLEQTPDNCLVFIDSIQYVTGKGIGARRVYLVDAAGGLMEHVPDIVGVIPDDASAIRALSILYTEMKQSYEIGDRLIQTIGEKDRTIREKQHQLLQDSKRHNAIIKHANDLIFIIGPTGKVMFSNDTFRQYLGERKDPASGDSFVDHVREEDHKVFTHMITKGFTKGVPARCEVRLNLASGRIGIFSLLGTPLEENGRIYALSVIGRDITDLRSLQQRLSLQANDLSMMINGLSHELRNPLTIIGAYIRRLEREGEKKTKRWEQALSGIYSSITRIEDMISRIERYETITKMEHTCTDFEVCGMIRQAVSSLSPGKPVHMHAPQPLRAFCDIDHVRVAFLRILENALENTPTEVRVAVEDAEGYSRVTVRDYGPGIQDDENTIFAPFYSTDPMKIGLGLTEARIAMAKVGGRIRVVPQADPGAAFVLMIPLDRRLRPRG
jgi:PAS domain S-box-containing protein